MTRNESEGSGTGEEDALLSQIVSVPANHDVGWSDEGVKWQLFQSWVNASGFSGVGAASTSSITVEEGTRKAEEISSSTRTVDENAVNEARLAAYREKLTEPFLATIRDSDFEYGYECAADKFVRERLRENALACKEWLSDLFVKYYHDRATVEGIARVVAHLRWDEIQPAGITIALSALQHASVEVREAGIRCFENWATLDCLRILRSVHCAEPWLEDYLKQVVSDLEQVLRVHVKAS